MDPKTKLNITVLLLFLPLTFFLSTQCNTAIDKMTPEVLKQDDGVTAQTILDEYEAHERERREQIDQLLKDEAVRKFLEDNGIPIP